MGARHGRQDSVGHRDQSHQQLIAETSKILKHIDWKPKYNDLSEIINSSIKWEEKINESNT